MADYAIEVVFSFDRLRGQKKPRNLRALRAVRKGVRARVWTHRGEPTLRMWTT